MNLTEFDLMKYVTKSLSEKRLPAVISQYAKPERILGYHRFIVSIKIIFNISEQVRTYALEIQNKVK